MPPLKISPIKSVPITILFVVVAKLAPVTPVVVAFKTPST